MRLGDIPAAEIALQVIVLRLGQHIVGFALHQIAADYLVLPGVALLLRLHDNCRESGIYGKTVERCRLSKRASVTVEGLRSLTVDVLIGFRVLLMVANLYAGIAAIEAGRHALGGCEGALRYLPSGTGGNLHVVAQH